MENKRGKKNTKENNIRIKSNKKYSNNIIVLNNRIIIIYIIINFLILSKCDNIIKLKINQKGAFYILSKEFDILSYPNETFINSEKQDSISSSYYFNDTDNIVELKWYNKITNCNYMFFDCQNIIEVDLTNFDMSEVEHMAYMFYNCNSMKILNLSNYDTPKLINLKNTFAFCTSLVSLYFSNFNTSLVTDMDSLFYSCSSLASLDLSTFQTSNVINMTGMFTQCQKLNSLDLYNFDTSNVITMYAMFSGCSSLSYLRLTQINTSQCTNTYHMFDNCKKLASLDLSSFDTSKVTTMEGMFSNCQLMNSLDLSFFNTSLVTNMEGMFYQCFYLERLDLSKFNTSSVTNMKGMFFKCLLLSYLDISNFNTSLVKDMSLMFSNCLSLVTVDLSSFELTEVETMESMFDNCPNLRYLDLSNSYAPKLKNLNYIFFDCQSLVTLNFTNFRAMQIETIRSFCERCYSLISLDLSGFNTSFTKDMAHMFFSCKALKFLDISNFDTSSAETIEGMFYECQSLVSLDLSKFRASQIRNAEYMLSCCSSLTYINLTNFNTSLVENMGSMFYECGALTSLDLSNFDTSRVKNMKNLFGRCYSLTYINLSNFNTSLVENMDGMFFRCESLTSLDLSSFDTSHVKSMLHMFSRCYSLKSLDLSSFDTSSVINMNNMFYNISYIEYINLQKFSDKSLETKNDMLFNIPDNIVICINESLASSIMDLIKAKQCYIIDCSFNWKLNQKKLIEEKSICVDKCENDTEYVHEYNGRCYKDCILTIKNNEYDICKCELEKCSSCSNEGSYFGLCNECNYSFNYYPKENDESNLDKYINCYKDEIKYEGYYLDINESIYKKCYDSCEICEIEGNNITHNCAKCKYNYSYHINVNNYYNCYNNCEYYYYINNETIFCTINHLCPDEYSKLIPNKSQCVKNCSEDDIYIYELNNTCINYNPNIELSTIITESIIEKNCTEDQPFIMIDTKKCKKYCSINEIMEKTCILRYDKITVEEIFGKKAEDIIIESIENDFITQYNTSHLDEGNDDKIIYDEMKIILSTTENQRKNMKKNLTAVDLGDCENELRNKYNISDNKSIYMKKIDAIQEGYKIPKIEYDVYCKLNDSNLIKLNLSICSMINIDISLPIIIAENLDILNTSSGYYNDICYKATSDYDTDIILKDRRQEFIDKKKTVCQDDCNFTEYDYNIKKVKCNCKVKEASLSFENIKINKTKLIKNFVDIKSIANIDIIFCYKELFSKEGIFYNIGSYIIILIIIFHIISIIIFFSKQSLILKNKINDIIFGITNLSLLKNKQKKNSINISKNQDTNNKIKTTGLSKKKPKKNNPPIKKKSKSLKIKNQTTNINKNYIYNIVNMDNKQGTKFIRNKLKKADSTINLKAKDEKLEKVRKIMEHTNEEKNELTYEQGLQYDKRSYGQYYISLIITKHNLISSFCNNNDYNSKIIKIDLFFFSFGIYLTMNVLFYDNDTMHEIYDDEGSFDFIYQLPKIIYSALISTGLNMLLKLLALSNDKILNFKKNKSTKNIIQRGLDLYNKLIIKFILYYILSFILLLCFWYYLSIFCAIYRNTQIHLLTETIISFCTSLLTPFGINLLPGIFRIPALTDKKKSRNCLFRFSKILQLL